MRVVALPVRLFAYALMLGALAACSPDMESPRSRTDQPVEPSWRGLQAYAYTSPVPPLESTPLDGDYRRVLTIAQAGGPPIACRRCAPFRLDAGTTQLRFDRGRFWLMFRPAGTGPVCPGCTPPGSFRATGHFVVEGGRVELFNDPNCEESRGSYRWSVRGGTLTFETLSDDCFGGIRGRFLTDRPWRAD